MRTQDTSESTALLILLVVIVFAVVSMALVAVGLSALTGSSGDSSSREGGSQAVFEPTRELPREAGVIATLTAAPPRPRISSDDAADNAASEEGGTGGSAAAYDPAVVAEGEVAYIAACSACHGPDARGMEGLGKNLIESEFVTSQTDDQLLAFVKVGRPIWDAENTTGIDMPPKGGNPALTDEQILTIIAYVRTLN